LPLKHLGYSTEKFSVEFIGMLFPIEKHTGIVQLNGLVHSLIRM
jgi:hypothetical protein